MGSRERREREREDTRRRILEAARELFVRHGYEATTMRAIAKRIEYTPTAIYHHFRNKEALLSELAATDFRALAQAFLRIGRVEDPIERLRRTGEAYVEFGLTHPMHYRLMFMSPGVPGRHDRDIARGDPGEDAYAFLRDTCAEAIEAGRFRAAYDDPEEVAQMLWGAMHGLVSLQIAKREDPWVEWRDVRETARRACETLLRGLVREGGE